MSEILESEIVQSMDDDGLYSAPLEIQNQSSEVDALYNANMVGLDLEEKESNNTKKQNCLVAQLGEENITSNVFIFETSSTAIIATTSLRQVQIDHDVENLSHTKLKELNIGIRLMVQCSKRFRIKKDHGINGKRALKGREEIINVHLANISMDDIEALLKDEIIEDMYQEIDKNDVRVETFYDDQPQVQPNGLHQLDLSIDLSDQRSYILYSLRPKSSKRIPNLYKSMLTLSSSIKIQLNIIY